MEGLRFTPRLALPLAAGLRHSGSAQRVFCGFRTANSVRLKKQCRTSGSALFFYFFLDFSAAYERILEGCKELKKYGVRAVTGACGFFGHYQKRLAAKLDIPVALSSLVQLPWIAATLKPDEKIAVLAANEESCTPDLLRACSVPDEVIERCVIRGLGKEPQFKVILDDSCEFDNAQIKQELLGKAEEIVREYPETGAFLLECTEMPPYAYLIQAATQCRVYDFITMLNWVHSGLCRRPFTGWV